jgi:hypothetical protein
MLNKTDPRRAVIRKQKAEKLRAMRHFERVIAPRLDFVEETVIEQLEAGKMTKKQAIEMIEREFLAVGVDSDVSAIWQALNQ